jgi:hypothetical protein
LETWALLLDSTVPEVFLYPELRRDEMTIGCYTGSKFQRATDSITHRWGLASPGRWDRLGLLSHKSKDYFPMTNRVTYAPQDFQKMCKQAERDHESKKLVVLMDRVKKQIAERMNPDFNVKASNSPVKPVGSSALRSPSRTVPFER